MKEPVGLQRISVDVLNDFVTNVDSREVSKNYALEIRGFRNQQSHTIGERDFGTKHTLANYPTVLGGSFTIVNFTMLNIPSTNIEYFVVVGIDASNKTRIFVKDAGLTDVGSTNNWIELTRVIKAVVNDGSIGASDTSVTIGTMTDVNGNAVTLATNELQYWMVKNVTNGTVAFINSSTATTITTGLIILGSGGLNWANGNVLEFYKTTALFDFTFANGVAPHVRYNSIPQQNKLNMYYGDSSVPVGTRRPIQAKRLLETKNYFYKSGTGLVALPERWLLESGGGLVKDFVKNGDAVDPLSGYLNGSGNVSFDFLLLDNFIFTSYLEKLKKGDLTSLTNSLSSLTFSVSITSDGEHVYIAGYSGIPNGAIHKYTSSLTFVSSYVVNNRTVTYVHYHQGYLHCVVAGKLSYKNVDVNDGSIGAGDTSVDITGASLAGVLANALIGYTVYNVTNDTQAVITSNTLFDGSGNGTITLDTIVGSSGLNWQNTHDLVILQYVPEVRKVNPSTMTLVSTLLLPAKYNDIDDPNYDNTRSTIISYNNNLLIAFDSYPNWRIIEVNPTSMAVGTFAYATSILQTGDVSGYVPKTMFYRNENGTDILFYAFGYNPTLYKKEINTLANYTYYTVSGGFGHNIFDFAVDNNLIYVCHNNFPNPSKIEIVTANFGDASGVLSKTWTFPTINNLQGLRVDNKYVYGSALNDSTPPSELVKINKNADVLQYPITNSKTVNDWLKVDILVKSDVTGVKGIVKGYVTVMYNGYEESDPVYQFYANPELATQTPIVSYKININPATMPKNVSGFRFYAAGLEGDGVTIPSFVTWVESPQDYVLMYELFLNKQNEDFVNNDWSNVNTDQFCVQFNTSRFSNISVESVIEQKSLSATNLYDNLNHAPDLDRSYLQSRYGVQASRTQGSIAVVEQDNSTLRLSSYDGDGVHEDDNFPDVQTDNKGLKQRVNLLRSDEILGIEIVSGVVLVFRYNSLEMFDLQSQTQNVIPIDCIAKRSIVNTPYGVVWCGNGGIYMFPLGGGGVRLLNPRWANYYDGSFFIKGTTTPYVTETFRTNAVCGFDFTYGELWVQLEVNKSGGTEFICFRYSFKNNRWFSRQLNIGSSFRPVVAFANSVKNFLHIGYESGILAYPNRSGNFMYEDDVSFADVSAGKGIPVKIKLMLGEIFDLVRNFVLWDVIVDGSSELKAATTGTYRMSLYGDRFNNAFHTMGFPMGTNDRPTPRGIQKYGELESVEVHIDFVEGGGNVLANVKNWVLSRITFGYVPRRRLGNL